MKVLSILIFSLSSYILTAQPLTPFVYPPVAEHPNMMTPPHFVPPPSPESYRKIDDMPGSAFSDANAAAMHFINIIDNQIYSGAWLDSGGIVHDVVPQRMWEEGMRATRMQLGLVKARRVTGHQTRNSLQGGLVGEFIIIRYATEFARKPNSVEIVTLMRHPPDIWKVISYQIE